MSKTIQVRIDDDLKSSADSLFTSLGMDTSTAIRIFLVAALEAGGIPFAVKHGTNHDHNIQMAINNRKNGVEFLSANQSLKNMKSAIDASVSVRK